MTLKIGASVRKGGKTIARTSTTIPEGAGSKEAWSALATEIGRQKNEYAKLSKKAGQGFRQKRKADNA